MRLQYALERARHHFLLPFALPLFRCQGGFLTAHGFFHLRNPALSFRLKSVFHRIDYRSSRILRFRRFPCIGFFSFRLRCSGRLSSGVGFHLRLSQPAQFRTSFRREIHHHFIESVDGRVRFPVQTAVHFIFRIIGFFRCGAGSRLFRCRDSRLRFGSRRRIRSAAYDFVHFACLFRGDAGNRFRISLIRCPFRILRWQGEQCRLHGFLPFVLSAFLPVRFQALFSHPSFLLRIAEQVIQVHYRSSRLSALRFL